ncbi:MAG: FAD-dependent oxidoreductase [Verrucomicrobiota bacterium]
MRFLAIFVLLCGYVSAQDVVIYGGTPGGITAAISAARLGREVTLVEYHDYIGGMTTSGLGKSDIENRAMIAKDVDGLLMAGRCISGDFIAHSSYRVTGNAVAMGEAAGVVAALAATSKRLPHEIAWSEGVAKLKAIGQRA